MTNLPRIYAELREKCPKNDILFIEALTYMKLLTSVEEDDEVDIRAKRKKIVLFYKNVNMFIWKTFRQLIVSKFVAADDQPSKISVH